MKSVKHSLLILASISIVIASCKSMNRTQKGAVVGTAGGAAVGAVIGKAAGNTALGAIIGATVGGVTGVIIGKKMDREAREIEKEVHGAKVERVGEGIVVEFNSKVLFEVNKYDLNNSAQNNLDELYSILQKYPDTDIEIQGHTDNTGTHDYNQSLSERRASAVASYLRGKGVIGSRVSIKGFGETAPKYDNDTGKRSFKQPEGRFSDHGKRKMKADAKKEAEGNN